MLTRSDILNVKKYNNKDSGITLIALVVTIIVLLILAGVAINLTIGNDGIITRAIKAREENEKAEIVEQIKMDIAGKQIDNQGSINEDDLYEILNNYGTISDDKSTLTTTKGNYEISIDNLYNVSSNKIKLYCDTLKLITENDITYIKANEKTQTFNYIYSDENVKEIQISIKSGPFPRFILSTNNDGALVLFLNCYANENNQVQLWYYKFQEQTQEFIGVLPGSVSNDIEYFELAKQENGNIIVNSISDQKIEKTVTEVNISNINEKYLGEKIQIGLCIRADELNDTDDNCTHVILYNNKIKSNLSGKTISFLGDSISAMSTNYNYGYRICKYLGAFYLGYGYGGSAVEGNQEISFINRVSNSNSPFYKSIDKKTDIIFILGGRNIMGNTGDKSDTTQETFYGAYKILIEYLKENYPNTKIILGTPLQSTSDNEILAERANAVKSLGEMYNLNVIDLYNNSGITSENANNYLIDGTHPNHEGYKLIAEYMVKELKKISI